MSGQAQGNEAFVLTLPGKCLEAFVLTLPGKCLDVSSLVKKKKKFRHRGGKDGALNTMRKLEESGMGKLVVKKSKGSVMVCSLGLFCKHHVMPVYNISDILINRLGNSRKPIFKKTVMGKQSLQRSLKII